MKAKNEFKQFKSDIEHEQVRSVVNTAAISILENPEHKYLLPTDQTIKGNILKTFQNSIWGENVKYDIREGKIIGVLDKEGQVVRDENYNPLTFEQYVHRNAKGYFEVSKADDRQGTGAGTQPPAGGSGSLNFKDREDYFNAYVKEKDPKTLDAMKKYEEEKIAKGDWK